VTKRNKLHRQNIIHQYWRKKGPSGSMSYVVGLPNNSCRPITNPGWVRARLCKLQKGYTWLAVTSDKVYQLLGHGRWFSPGTAASSNTKIGRHQIAEILLKVALSTINQIKSEERQVFKSNMYQTSPRGEHHVLRHLYIFMLCRLVIDWSIQINFVKYKTKNVKV
jgi:hypothetical protein